MKNRNSILLLTILAFCIMATGGFFVNATSSEKANLSNTARSGSVQFYSTASRDDMNVYGTATLTENSPSGLSYRVTVTVTSPSGHSNTTQSDWSSAPITHTTGLSIGDEDGTFSVQATYESQSGTYDQYGSFTGKGNTASAGSSTSSAVVAPFVALRAVGFPPFEVNEVSAGQTLNISAKIFSSRGVPVDALVTLEINETDVPTAQYSVIDVEDSNPTWNNSTPGQVYRLIRNPGTVLETTIFRIRIPSGGNRAGKIPSQIRIDNASVGVAQPEFINFVVNVNSTTSSNGGNECFFSCTGYGGSGFQQVPTDKR